MNKLNAKWHLSNKLPDYLVKYKGKKTEDEIRGLWHKKHLKHCSCRTNVPQNLKKYIV